MAYLNEMDSVSGFVDAEAVLKKGSELAEEYNSANPFPHIVIDDFLPEDVLEMCLSHFPKQPSLDSVEYDRDQERLKTSYNPDVLSVELRTLFYSFNSRPFIKILENITGIKGLIPDPYFFGGGFHEIKQGGHLSIHADFNHHKPMNLERRINLLIYLNKDWKDEYGGQLELWDEKMMGAVQSVVPAFNRCVIFNTTSESYHGNPHPVNHPGLRSRKSIALYYYTATWQNDKRSHTTQFQVRPESADKFDMKIWIEETTHDLMPPIVFRGLRRLKKMVSRPKSDQVQ